MLNEEKPVIVITTIKCINCGNKISGTIGQLINIVPICEECRKTKTKAKRVLTA